jgi:PHD/YefM family antitoxin component YafN of YafNO toxin-antitoxin module
MELFEEKFCFKFLAESGMAQDEEGNAVEVLASISIEVPEKLDEEKYKEGAEQFKIALARQVDTDPANIVIISVEEYNAEAYDEEGNEKQNVLTGRAELQTAEDGPLGEFNEIAYLLPEEVKEDVMKRINDWIEGGGNVNDKYVLNQVEYAKRVAKMMMEAKLDEFIPKESESES